MRDLRGPLGRGAPAPGGGIVSQIVTNFQLYRYILRFATGTIAKSYKVGQEIEVVISILANSAVSGQWGQNQSKS